MEQQNSGVDFKNDLPTKLDTGSGSSFSNNLGIAASGNTFKTNLGMSLKDTIS